MPIPKMKSEKIVLSFIAVLIGILVTGIAFYLYQSTKSSPTESPKKIVTAKPSPTPQPALLSLKAPTDEMVVSKKVISVEGSAEEDATIVVISPVDQVVLSPSGNGDFKTTIDIDDGENIIEVTSISSNGTQTSIKRTVTYSTEEF